MKNKLLLSTAVVLASVGLASAQNVPGNSHEGASRQGGAQQSEQHSPQSQQRNAQGGQNAQGAQRQPGAQSGEHETTGQAPSSARDQSNSRDQNNAAPNSERNRSPAAHNQAQDRNEPNQGVGRTNREPNQRTGQQAPNERIGSPGRAENQGGNRNTAQQPRQPQQTGRAENEDANRNTAQQPQQQRTGQNQGEQGRGNVNLTSEQRTKIRETMLNGRNVPRVNNVNFALNVGAAVPSNVRIVEVPDTLIEIHPEWRSYSYFVLRDEIVIVDSGRRVIAIVPAGGSSARVDNGGGARGAMNLDRTQIREVQFELQRQGFDIGEPDGMLGPRTREAVIAFQKQRGFKANGEIDHDTFAALSGNEGARGEQSSPNDQNGRGRSETTGQAPAGRNVGPSGAQGNNPQSSSQGGNTSHNASESPGGNRPSAGGPSTTGQSGGNLSGREENPSPAQGNRRRNENPH